MSSFKELYNNLFVLSLVIIGSSLLFLCFSVSHKNKTINALYWFGAFTGFYIGGGCLTSLFSAADQSLESLFYYYEISDLSIIKAYWSWGVFCISLFLVSIILRPDFSVDLLKNKTGSFFNSFQMMAFIVLVIFCSSLAYLRGGLGYGGQEVGSLTSSYEINPFNSLVYTVLIGAIPLYFAFCFNTFFSFYKFTFLIVFLLFGISLGRRMLTSLLLLSGLLYLLANENVVLEFRKRIVPTIVFCIVSFSVLFLASRFFYGLRVASWEASQENKVRSLVNLFLPAFKIAFLNEGSDFNYIYNENLKVRPFGPFGFFIYTTDLFSQNFGFCGKPLFASTLITIPRFFLKDKDILLEESGEDEVFIARFLSINKINDEAPTVLSSGLINFGLFGIFLNLWVIAVLVIFVRFLYTLVNNDIFTLVTISNFLANMQFAETTMTSFFVETRNLLILALPLLFFKFFFKK